MNKRHLIITTIALFIGLQSQPILAQTDDWKFGFELGWANSKIQGELETAANGEEAETQRFNTGFHLSLYGRKHLTDQFGVQVGITYAQRGTEYNYEGDSYYLFGKQGSQVRFTDVQRRQTEDVRNGYLDIPVIAFYKIGRIEIGAGAYGGLLIGSKSDGEVRVSDTGTRFETFFVNTEKKYISDRFSDEIEFLREVEFGSLTYEEPRIIGAYYEYLEDPGETLFNRLDLGLVAQLGYYFNESLNIKGRFSYGLTDVTRQEADIAKASTSAGGLTFRDDTDRNLSMQISIGFLF